MLAKPKKCCTMGSYECQIPMPINGRIRHVDFCIADIVAALNAANITTVASCCGHGDESIAIISLEDGRELSIKNHAPKEPEGQTMTCENLGNSNCQSHSDVTTDNTDTPTPRSAEIEYCSKCGKALGPVRISLFNGEKMHYACAVEFESADSWDRHVAELNTTIGRLEHELKDIKDNRLSDLVQIDMFLALIEDYAKGEVGNEITKLRGVISKMETTTATISKKETVADTPRTDAYKPYVKPGVQAIAAAMDTK